MHIVTHPTTMIHSIHSWLKNRRIIDHQTSKLKKRVNKELFPYIRCRRTPKESCCYGYFSRGIFFNREDLSRSPFDAATVRRSEFTNSVCRSSVQEEVFPKEAYIINYEVHSSPSFHIFNTLV